MRKTTLILLFATLTMGVASAQSTIHTIPMDSVFNVVWGSNKELSKREVRASKRAFFNFDVTVREEFNTNSKFTIQPSYGIGGEEIYKELESMLFKLNEDLPGYKTWHPPTNRGEARSILM